MPNSSFVDAKIGQVKRKKQKWDQHERAHANQGCEVFALRDTKAHNFEKVKIKMMEGAVVDMNAVRDSRFIKKMDLADGVLKSAEHNSTKTLTREAESQTMVTGETARQPEAQRKVQKQKKEEEQAEAHLMTALEALETKNGKDNKADFEVLKMMQVCDSKNEAELRFAEFKKRQKKLNVIGRAEFDIFKELIKQTNPANSKNLRRDEFEKFCAALGQSYAIGKVEEDWHELKVRSGLVGKTDEETVEIEEVFEFFRPSLSAIREQALARVGNLSEMLALKQKKI